MKKVAWVAGIVLVLLIAVRVAIGFGASPSDQAQIQKALQDSIQASKEGKPGGVMDLLSSQIKFNQQDAGGNMGSVAQFIKNQRPDVEVTNQQAIVTGDTAQITSPVNLKLDFLGQQRTVHLKNVVLIFKREATTHWLILPSKTWKLAEIDAPDAGEADFLQ